MLETGAEILGEYLYPIGFHFEVISEGRGSGGTFAEGEFKNILINDGADINSLDEKWTPIFGQPLKCNLLL